MKTLRNAVLAVVCLAGAAVTAAPDDDQLVGMSASVGGGAIGFLHSEATDVGDLGGQWMARLGIGTRSLIGAELAYIGTAQGLSTLGLSDRAMLVSNGAEGALRLNLNAGDWQPYAIAGIAWRHYTVTNSASNTSSVKDADDIGEVPMGLGLTYRFEPVFVDLRVTYRQVFAAALIPSTNLSSLDAAAKVGFDF